jgi:hypothetical protein
MAPEVTAATSSLLLDGAPMGESSLTGKYMARLESSRKEKHSSLFVVGVSGEGKKVYNTERHCLMSKLMPSSTV